MKLLWLFLALSVGPIVQLTCAQVTGAGGRPSAIDAGITRFAAKGVVDVGVDQIHEISHEDEQVRKDLIEKFEADGQATGEISCLPCPCRTRTCGTRPTVSNGGTN